MGAQLTETEQVVWEGPDWLGRLLVPIGSLEPFPGNPRRGAVPAVAASLRRFGQVKPVVVDGSRIVAGHHVVLAARELGWTHIAAGENSFRDEDEQRAFLLADNRTSELGSTDEAQLVEHLRLLDELDALEGTGYSRDDLDERLAAMRRLHDEALQSPLNSDGKQREHRDPAVKEVVLLYSEAQLADLESWLAIVAKERGTAGVSETVYACVRADAEVLNQS